MIQTVNYTPSDIEKFIEITEIERQKEHNATLRKLLNVKDKISIFKNIPSLELQAIVKDLKFIKFKYKDHIIDENDTSENIFFIITGECHVFHNKKIVGKLGSGEIFGESAAIFKTKRNASIVCASKEATLLSFCIDEENMEFCATAIAMLYKNLALQINTKLEDINSVFIKK